MGYPMHYASASEIFDEFVACGKAYGGLSHAKLGKTGKLYPCPDPDHSDGTVVMFGDGFPTPDGRARFVPAEHNGCHERPDKEFPYVLITGRILEHWHTGVMTRRSAALDAIEPEAFVEVHPEDCARLGLEEGDFVRVSSRRGAVHVKVRIDTNTHPGSIFMPFHFREAAANVLTTDRLDPDGKIPEFKFCAVQIEKP